MSDSNFFSYPEEIKEEFLQTEDIQFRDGSKATPAEVWEFLTKEGPVRYPFAYDHSRYHGRRFSKDMTLPYTLKHNYLILTMNDRMTKAKKNGVPVVFAQGGQSVDPYYAAGAIGLRPASVNIWARGQQEGLNLVQEQVRSSDQKEKAYRATSFEICQSAGYENIQEGTVPVDIIAPYTCLRCSDISYGLEAHRHGGRKDVKLLVVDYPLGDQKNKEWAIEYFAENIRRLTDEISKLTGKKMTAGDLSKEIKLHNEGRRLALEIADLWWSATVPPTSGEDRRYLLQMGGMEIHGDPVATLSVLREARKTIENRVKNGQKGLGVSEKAARLFLCGSCVQVNNHRTEEAGGIVVGTDNHWSDITTIVEEDGDPFYNLAKAILSYPYEQTIQERAQWTIDQINKSRADGALFMYNWGCNTQSAVARAICDQLKKKLNLPTLIIEHEMRGTQSEQLQNRVNAFVEMIQ
ncbi:2-hydroxyglutaryl-CoA dehydratase, D-component [Ruminiclostridium hungatei]|uniref:2-hydroxyglutaryl-CoA dehydratase, D-component n=1 Tax=Ruminiclostridium hungatei TaxID=48256 RepID=A0A1V4SP02_RUMHU|nr:2-hydroxyacyl-CoA dehydratase family protein [Ruminiclostridium hungatei]OPX44981.1 2-hydroxyglutaryl-CoA dehydratase, D-component [Ruminiclostridium hungatei]